MDKKQKNKRSGIGIEREKYWQDFWGKEKLYKFKKSKKPTYSIDTPPPTVSGKLHLGHIFSYSQADIIARYQRMAGQNVFYPFGLDNNGLPTERLIEKDCHVKGHKMKRGEFAKLVRENLPKYHERYIGLFKKLGFSYDWSSTYLTISPEIQKETQKTFTELFKKKRVYQKKAPALYCWECRTSVAQAEVEDKSFEGIFFDIVFKKEDGSPLLIATTRPELLPACVAVFVHPTDKRYENLIGKNATTALGSKVKIYADKEVDIDKGTGVVMVCTYGDETDLRWVRKYKLPEKVIFDQEGKFNEKANDKDLIGKTIKEGRQIIIEKLKKKKLIKKEMPYTHDVGVHERCGTPIEFIPAKQWFVKILDLKKKILETGRKVDWQPPYMLKRFEEWVKNLKWDWCISRQRFYGIPIPVVGKENKDESAVFDTWFTSARTPEIIGYWPASMRPQAHDIIRTWAMYTITMGVLKHGGKKPWERLMISGHVLAKKGKKISKKTGGGAYDPLNLIEEHSADAIRYAMYGANLGKDGYFEEERVETGKRLIRKLYNSTRFTLSHLTKYKPQKLNQESLEAADAWILNQAEETAQKMAKALDNFEYSKALLVFENFFWKFFCDNYLEIIKERLYQGRGKQKESARYALYHTKLNILKMLSPFMPHITEELYHDSKYFVKCNEMKSIHLTDWPKMMHKISNEAEKGAQTMLEIISLARKEKEKMKMGLGTAVKKIRIECPETDIKLLAPYSNDLKSVIRAKKIEHIKSNKLKILLVI